jgi:drug/metabolite transporter (DMT)-like permease
MPGASGRMQVFGLVMEIFGVVMVLTSTFIPGMNASLSDGMLIVGATMILNGAFMQRTKKGAMGRPAEAQ